MKKNRDKWCKGVEGVNHTIVVRNDGRTLADLTSCHQSGKKWLCVHYKYCPKCDRVLTYEWDMTPDDCPDFAEAAVPA